MSIIEINADRSLKQMKYRLNKSHRFIVSQFDDLKEVNPELAEKKKQLQEQQLAERKAELLALLQMFKDYQKRTDHVTNCYNTFIAHCPAENIFKLTDKDRENLPLEQLLTCLNAKAWRDFYSSCMMEITEPEAVYLAVYHSTSPYFAVIDLAFGKAMQMEIASQAIGV